MLALRQVLIPVSLARVPALADPGPCLTLDGQSMGTTWQVQVYAPAGAAAELRTAIEATLAQVVRQMSHWEADSELTRFNRAAAHTQVALPAPLFELLQHALDVAADSGGAYDPTLGTLVRRWGFGPERAHCEPGFRLPETSEIAAMQARCGWQRLQLVPGTRLARQPGGLDLDLSSIAKGFAVDLVSQRLLRDGFATHLVEIGGELRGAGLKPDAQPWWVGLESPTSDAALDEVRIALCDRAIATSGDYRRWYAAGDRRIAHTLDPRTGRPVDNDLAAVTVLGNECWYADAVSTALLVMGAAEGLAWADARRIAARFVRRSQTGLRECCSRAWSDMLL